MTTDTTPLCIDLDGTLVRTDLLAESVLTLVRERPLSLLRIPVWLSLGKANLKQQIARDVELRVDLLPYNETVLSLAGHAREAGRKVVLATASNRKYAEEIASHLGVFDRVLASDANTNLAERAKAAKLEQLYGNRGFDYIGNSKKDIAIWKHARRALVADPKPGVLAELKDQGLAHEVVTTGKSFVGPLLKAMRPHQWLKNLLVALPLLTAHLYDELPAVLAALLAFLAFCLMASAGYLVNDLLDIDADRQHLRKRLRPFASGDLPIALGIALIPSLILSAVGIALTLPPLFLVVLLTYLATTLAYSLYLKRKPTIDVLTLAGLYTLRVIGGTAALALSASFWLLAFSMFLFLSLAFVKRYAEIESVKGAGDTQWVAGRAYHVDDLDLIRTLGISAGFGAVVVLALYINSPEIRALYSHPELIWLVCLVMLYWIARAWTVAHRGAMHDDPLVFAIQDRVSLATILTAAVIAALAI